MLRIQTKALPLMNLLDKPPRTGICSLSSPTGAQHNDPPGREKLRPRGGERRIPPTPAYCCIPVGIWTALLLRWNPIERGIDHYYLSASREKRIPKEEAAREAAEVVVGAKEELVLEVAKVAKPRETRVDKAPLKARVDKAPMEPLKAAMKSSYATVNPPMKATKPSHPMGLNLCGEKFQDE